METLGVPPSSAAIHRERDGSRARIAVIAVHDAADHQPADSAAEVAGILLSLPDARYASFEQHAVHVALHPVQIADCEQASVAHRAMHMRVAGYKGTRDRTTYDTTRLEGERSDGTRVDVFEMYWADLSRVARGPLAFFGALYQLVLHLPELGAQAVAAAALDHRDSRIWRLLAAMQTYAVWLLVLPITLLTAILLAGSLAPVMARLLSLTSDVIASAALGGIVGAASYATFHKPRYARRVVWSSRWSSSIALGGGVGAATAVMVGSAGGAVLVALEWWLTAWVLLHLALRRYERVRPGALWVGHVLYVGCAAIFLWCLVATVVRHEPTYYPGATGSSGNLGNLLSVEAVSRVDQAALWIIQLEWVLLRALWFMLWIVAFAIALTGFIATAQADGCGDHVGASARRDRARVALRTGRLLLAWPAIGVLLLTTILWGGGFSYIAQHTEAFRCLPPSTPAVPDWLERRVPDPVGFSSVLQLPPMPADSPCPGRPSIQQYFQVLLVLTVGSGLVATLALAGLGSLLLLRVTLPSLSASDASGRMRGWRASLFRGLGSTSAVTWLLWIAIFVIPPVGVVGLHGPFPPFLAAGLHAAQRFTISTIGVIAILATVMMASITMLGGSVLDVVLSLDNYLRTLPDDEAPQARIVERYVSLLRHIASAGTTAETPTPYTAVVIVATSFGALISTDVLGFLTIEARQGAGRCNGSLTRLGYGPGGRGGDMPVYLFAIGDPLHRLVSGFFPHQYSPSASPRPVTAPAIFPSLDQLGLTGSETADRGSPEIAQRMDAVVGIATSVVSADPTRA